MIRQRLDALEARIVTHAARFGHRRDQITLVGVTKFVDEAPIRTAIAAGLTHIGENQVQEIERKHGWFEGASIHMIGQLQSNKVRKLPKDIALIQSVDRLSLIREIEHRGALQDRTFRGLIQVNIAEEPQKGGVRPDDLQALISSIETLDHLRIEGLMCTAPHCDDPEDARPCFRAMRKLFERLSEIRYNNIKMNILSMGMSHDFGIALEEGATMIRVGSALFGSRHYN